MRQAGRSLQYTGPRQQLESPADRSQSAQRSSPRQPSRHPALNPPPPPTSPKPQPQWTLLPSAPTHQRWTRPLSGLGALLGALQLAAAAATARRRSPLSLDCRLLSLLPIAQLSCPLAIFHCCRPKKAISVGKLSDLSTAGAGGRPGLVCLAAAGGALCPPAPPPCVRPCHGTSTTPGVNCRSHVYMRCPNTCTLATLQTWVPPRLWGW